MPKGIRGAERVPAKRDRYHRPDSGWGANLRAVLRVTDHSSLTPGTVVLGRKAGVCPRCGKVGLAVTVGGRTFYLHSEKMGFNDQGVFVTQTEECSCAK